MKKIISNRKLTENFYLYEFIEAPAQIAPYNWRHIQEFDEDGYELMANFLQAIRDVVNIRFRNENGGYEIGIKVTSAFRCLEWELSAHIRNPINKKRDGTSQHCKGVAADIQPIGCSNELAAEIIRWLWKRDWERDTGHVGGFAVKWPTVDQHGRVLAVGFAHYDFRATVARWEY